MSEGAVDVVWLHIPLLFAQPLSSGIIHFCMSGIGAGVGELLHRRCCCWIYSLFLQAFEIWGLGGGNARSDCLACRLLTSLQRLGTGLTVGRGLATLIKSTVSYINALYRTFPAKPFRPRSTRVLVPSMSN